MKFLSRISKSVAVVSIALLFSLLSGCEQNKENQGKPPVSHEKASQSFSQQVSQPPSMPMGMNRKMVVTSILNAGPYLYIEGEENGVQTWIAATPLTVEPGDEILFESGQTMLGFHSKTLDRNFDEVVFTNLVVVVNEDGTVKTSNMQQSATTPQQANPHNNGLPTIMADETISVQKAEGGYTVEEIHAKRNELNGQVIKVRGKVVKFLPRIMKRNWLHLQDGTGGKETNDLTVTTQEFANNGDTVVCTGKLVVDRDFGQGYSYALIMEDASISSE